jgi:putative RecB family exonuclease|tara:strand:- start:6290 stop:7066 length:777 start_codon:yes stop_codon:yes gene_type:complete
MFINTISESKSKTFKECQLKYRYRYVDRFKEERTNTDPLHFGSYIHKIFEDGYQATTLAQLSVIAEDVKKDYTFSKSYIPKIKTCLENFLRFNASLSETVSTEMVYEIVYDKEKDLKLNGIIDRVIKGTDGGYLVIDYKTSKRELSELDLYQDRQMQGYAYAIHKKLGVSFDKIVVAHYYPLTNHFVTCKYSLNQIRQYLREKVDQMWKIRKMKKDEFKAMQNQFCNWCGYKNLCPEFNSGRLCEERIQKIRDARSNK